MNQAVVAAVIPVRFGDVCYPDGTTKILLSGVPLWSYTIDAALNARAAADHRGHQQDCDSRDASVVHRAKR